MEILIIIALIVAGLLLFAVEVFLVPGITLAGIASGVSLLYAIYYAFHAVGTQAGFITLAVVAVGIIGVTIWFMRSKTVDRLSLKKTLDYKPEPLKGTNIQVGRHRYVADTPYTDRKRRNKRTHCRGTVGRRIHRRTDFRTRNPYRQQHCVCSTLQPAVIFNLKYPFYL